MIITGAIDFKGEHVKVPAHQLREGRQSGQDGKYQRTDGASKFGSITGILVETENKNTENGKKKRIASPDLWEYTRLKGGNVLNLVEDQNFENM